jgi:hypothetical protein
MELWGFIGFVVVVAYAAVHILFAYAVFKDSNALEQDGKKLVLVGPWIWALATLFFGVFGALGYWAAHHSTLQTGLESRRPSFRSQAREARPHSPPAQPEGGAVPE